MWRTVLTGWLLASAAAEDSLRPALHAVQKRQRDLTPPPIYYTRNNILYGDGQPEDIGYGYQKSVGGSPGLFEAIAIPYSELGASYDPETSLALGRLVPYETPEIPSEKRSVFRERGDSYEDQDTPYLVPSSFRERMASERPQSHTTFARTYPASLARDSDNEISDDNYIGILNSIREKYQGEVDPEDLTDADVDELLESLGKVEKKRQYGNYNTGYDFFNSPLSWTKRSLKNDGHHKRYQETLFDERYPYRGGQKRFPITKRSPSSTNTNSVSHRHKKNTPEKQTDPKVAAELNNIFATEQKKENKTALQTPTITSISAVIRSSKNKTQSTGQKEQTVDVNALKPLDVKKKSINWSDYFGIDRRKKSTDSREVNNDWLLKKYLEAYGVKDSMSPEKHMASRIDGEDNKMSAMEDMIVDQAIKYTGSHEGSTDSNEIQEVKDKVIAQLATAYSLEKMRRALGEFKTSLAAQKASRSNPLQNSEDPDYKLLRLMQDKGETQGKLRIEKKDSNELTNEIDFGTLGEKACPVLRGIDRRCKKISALTGDLNELFLNLCDLHDMCYLCGPVLRAASPRECDSAFLQESEALCREEPGCLDLARKTLSFSRSLKPDPGLACDWRNTPCLAQFLALANNKR